MRLPDRLAGLEVSVSSSRFFVDGLDGHKETADRFLPTTHAPHCRSRPK